MQRVGSPPAHFGCPARLLTCTCCPHLRRRLTVQEQNELLRTDLTTIRQEMGLPDADVEPVTDVRVRGRRQTSGAGLMPPGSPCLPCLPIRRR